MATLEINGKEYNAKFNFQFSKLADAKYGDTDSKDNEVGGFQSVYMGLLQASNDSLLAFWDCGLSYLKGSEKPSIESIQEAIVARIEADGDSEPMLKEAYKAIDESGFFKQQSKRFWKKLRADEIDWQNRGRKRTESESFENWKLNFALYSFPLISKVATFIPPSI